MRVATHAYTDAMVSQYNLLTAKQFTLQNQVSTGLRVSAPADDPAAMENALNLVSTKSVQTQYGKNIATLQDRATQIYNSLQALQDVSSKVGAVVTQAGSSNNLASTSTYVSQLNGYINDALKQANATDPTTGDYLFGGTKNGQPPFTTTTDANGQITGVTYNGNASVNQTDIGTDNSVTVDVPGANTSGSGARGLFTDAANGADFFSHLIKLRDDVAANTGQSAITANTTVIAGADNDALKKDANNFLYHISNNGVVQSRLDVASTQLTNNLGSLNTAISNQTSADMVQTIMQLNQAQSSYQAALQSGAKIMQLSILNYIQ
jgi:flagellar hook-associated protein 3 FlgL